MKIKGISLVEQHAEKAILGIAVIALVGVAAWQIISHPNRVSMGGREVNPGDVDAILRERAEALSLQLRDDAPPKSDAFSAPPPLLHTQIQAALNGEVAPVERLARLEPALGEKLLPIDIGADTWYYEPNLPAPQIIAQVTQTADALDDGVLAQFPVLAERFSVNGGAPRGPLDMVWTTPAAQLPVLAMQRELRASATRQSPPLNQVPTPWFNDTLYVVDLICQRQELQPDGTWSEPIDIKPIPGQVSFRDRLKDVPDAALRNDVFGSLGNTSMQQELLQPEFLPTKNSAFTAPQIEETRAANQVGGTDDEVADLKRMLEARRAERARVWEKLDALGGPLTDPGKSPREPSGPEPAGPAPGGGATAPGAGGAAGGGTTGGGGGKRSTTPKAGDEDRAKKRRIQMTKTIETIDRAIDRLEKELERLQPGAAEEVVQADAVTFDLNADENVLVWAHDIDVEPGHIYRYRFVARVYNPFFARKRQLVAEQQDRADRFTLATAPSGWSDPVEVTPPVAFYLVRAEPGAGPLGLGNAVFEVFRLYDGKWSREQMSVSPGDRIGRVVDAPRGTAEGSRVDFSTDWFVVDIADDPAVEKSSSSGGAGGGIVVIQQISTGQRMELRLPQSDQSRPERQRLYKDWRETTVASTAGN